MTNGSGDTGFSAIVQSHHTAVGKGELEFALALLLCYLTGYGAVHFVGEPVFTSHSFELEHILEIFIQEGCIVLRSVVVALHGIVGHHGLRRVTKHLCYVEVEGAHAVFLLKSEVSIASGFTHHIERCALTFGNFAHLVDIFFFDEEAHALLTLVGNDFFGREGGISDGECAHVDGTATFFHEFRKTVDVSSRTVVVDGHHGVVFFFAKRTHEVGCTLLHFRIRTLHSVELDARVITSGVYRRNRTTTQTDAVVVTTHDNDFVAFLGSAFEAVALCAITHTTSEHDHLVEGIVHTVFCMLEGEHRSCDEGLSEFITEVGSTVGGFGEDLLRSLVEPGTFCHVALPRTTTIKTRIGSHIDSCTCDRERTYATSHTVANFTTRTCRSSVERLYSGGEVVRFCLDRDYTLDVANDKVVGSVVTCRRKLFHHRTFCESDIVFISREDAMGILLCSAFDHGEEGRRLLLAVDDERTTEDFVTTVFGIELCEAKDFTVGEFSVELLFYTMEIFHFGGRKSQTFLLVVGFEIINCADGIWSVADGEDILVKTFVKTLKHRVMICRSIFYGEEFFNAQNAAEIHILCDLNGIRTPRRNHFSAWSYIAALKCGGCIKSGFAKKPAKFFHFIIGELVIHLCGNDALRRCAEKRNHVSRNVWGYVELPWQRYGFLRGYPIFFCTISEKDNTDNSHCSEKAVGVVKIA